MRRVRQQLPPEEAEEILRTATAGVLAVAGDDGYPYAVPVSYVYAGGKIYFHSALHEFRNGRLDVTFQPSLELPERA